MGLLFNKTLQVGNNIKEKSHYPFYLYLNPVFPLLLGILFFPCNVEPNDVV